MAKLLTVLETAQLLGCSPVTLVSRQWRARFSLPAIKIGRSLMFDPVDLERVIAARKEQHVERLRDEPPEVEAR